MSQPQEAQSAVAMLHEMQGKPENSFTKKTAVPSTHLQVVEGAVWGLADLGAARLTSLLGAAGHLCTVQQRMHVTCCVHARCVLK